ncbi:MAG: ribonuclease HI [bacterium]
MITIYTDGSSRGNPGPGGYAAVIFYEKSQNKEYRIKNNEWVTEIGGHEEHTTNNRMELRAAIEALKFVSKTQATLFTDSKYVMQGITEWIHNWQKKGWKTANRKPVLNQDLWQKLLQVSGGKEIEWKYVEGHTGHVLNERADEIATSFADLPRASRGADSIKLYDGPRKKYDF